ncbi:MtN3-like protein [Phytophthora cinnamomi]|uniref:MtN3-like protein n=1 Tax=Phytophthora cinnamomi TaxID=4785 RepID=UPI00355A4032|nr:MtN3-like protein [Phytophthora cinnamomi]
MVAILAVITIYAIVGGFGYTSQSRDNMGSVMGFFADVSAICMYAAPMEKLLQVLKYRSAAFINAHMVVAGLTNNCLWFTYGVLTDNWFVIAPAIIFMSLNTFTLVLCVIFDPKTHPLPDGIRIDADNESEATSVAMDLTPKSRNCKEDNTLPSPAFVAIHSPLECIQVSK